MQWTPLADKCKLLLCVFMNWLGFSFRFPTKPVQKEPCSSTVPPQVCVWQVMLEQCLPAQCGLLPWLWCFQLNPSTSVCVPLLSAELLHPCLLVSGSLLRFEIGLVLAFCVLQKLPVLLPNPGCWQRKSFQGQWDILWVVPNGFAVYSDPAVGCPTQNGLACWRFPMPSVGAILFIFNLLPLACNCTWVQESLWPG